MPQLPVGTQASQQTQGFLEAYLRIHKRLYTYVVSLVPSLGDADEVFQRTSLVLWEKWGRFDPESEFFLWACGIARIQSKRYLLERGRVGQTLGDEAAHIVAQALDMSAPLLDARIEALQTCFEKLPAQQRSLLRRCYSDGGQLHEIAVELRMTPNALYLRLKRLRELLHACINGVLVASRSL